MNVTTGFLVYATLFRLAIIAVGLLAILLGYFLFIKDPVGQGKTTASLEKGGFKLTLKNFWPGVYFAAFGTVIIGLMLWQGNPELIIDELKTFKDSVSSSEGKTTVSRMSIRGGYRDVESCWTFLSDPEQTLAQAAQPISRLAELWRQEGRTGEALAMARLATRIEPQNATYLALLARLFLDNNEYNKALNAMEAAAKLDNKYKHELADLRALLP